MKIFLIISKFIYLTNMNNFCKSDALAQLLVKQFDSNLDTTWYVFPSVQICEKMDTWTRYWDERQKVPYGCNGNQFVGYDDIESTTIKVQNS
jgi:GH18 family chitinase